MNEVDLKYFKLVNQVLDYGRWQDNRTGIRCKSIFGAQARFDLGTSFPILTTKKVFFKGVVHELLWFLSGSTNIGYLKENGVRIWDEWADAKNELGFGTYGSMWRNFPYTDIHKRQSGDFTIEGGVDQIKEAVKTLIRNPSSRRIIVSAWHPYWAHRCALAPCHVLFHFNTTPLDALERWREYVKHVEKVDNLPNTDANTIHKFCDERNVPRYRLDCLLYQRSCDLFLGVPFNISSYALLTCMMAQVTNMVPGSFVHTYGDLHIYENHMDAVREQLKREPKELPALILNRGVKDIFEFRYEDVKLIGYNPHSAIKAEVAV